ncbi:MAG: rRNA maturation RNase YbeY [Myxococcota bacterium]
MTVLLTGGDRAEGLPAVDRRLLRSRAAGILRALSRGRSELSIALVDDAAIALLNARYRGKHGPTDVLSFSQLEDGSARPGPTWLGDVVISLETARRQARRAHRSLDGEVARLLIHGTLHLLGHDHLSDDEARQMRREERRLWRAIQP